ncbi:MAG TPA: lamin tail domain-containing protein, partial [Longimicrobiaceae bacterium]|nr:lamin tail domain-containing protein [Longimicrobiaceae bacterium]
MTPDLAVSPLLALLLAAAYEAAPRSDTAHGGVREGPRAPVAAVADAPGAGPRIVVSEVMPDPQAVPDEAGEWIELYNAGGAPAELRGWRLASRSDPGHTVSRSLVVRPGAAVVLARNGDAGANGGVRADYAYGGDLTLANGSDWLVLRDARGAVVDSVGWSSPPRRGASWALRDLGGERADVAGAAWAVSEESFGRG